MPIEIEGGLERTWTTGRIAPTRRPPFGGRLRGLERVWTTGRIAPTRRPPFGGRLRGLEATETREIPSLQLDLIGISKTGAPLTKEQLDSAFAPVLARLGLVFYGQPTLVSEKPNWVWVRDETQQQDAETGKPRYGKVVNYTATVRGGFADGTTDAILQTAPKAADNVALSSLVVQRYQATVVAAPGTPPLDAKVPAYTTSAGETNVTKAAAMVDAVRQAKRALFRANPKRKAGKEVQVVNLPDPTPPAPNPLPMIFGSLVVGVIGWNVLQHSVFKRR